MTKDELKVKINSIREKESGIRRSLIDVEKERRVYEKKLFLFDSPYKDGDIVIAKIRHGFNAWKEIECLLYVDYNIFWHYKLYPRKKDGKFSDKKHFNAYDVKEIIRKVE